MGTAVIERSNLHERGPRIQYRHFIKDGIEPRFQRYMGRIRQHNVVGHILHPDSHGHQRRIDEVGCKINE